MLKKRLIPKLQLSLRETYKGPKPILMVTKEFNQRRGVGDPLSQAKIYEAQLVDELILVDIDRSEASWHLMLNTLEKMAIELATPLTVGGGLKNYEQVQKLLDRGADKVVLNTATLENPNLIDKVSKSYGSQCIVLSIDVRLNDKGSWQVWGDSGRRKTERDAIRWAKEVTERGAGEVMVTAIDRDGTGKGLELPLMKKITETIKVPLIASGGCGLAQHFVEGYQVGAAAVAAGTFFSQRDQSPMQCRSHIRNGKVPIRLEI